MGVPVFEKYALSLPSIWCLRYEHDQAKREYGENP
jgi:hypothetical protein